MSGAFYLWTFSVSAIDLVPLLTCRCCLHSHIVLDWRAIAQRDSVLRASCIAHGYIDHKTTLEDLRAPCMPHQSQDIPHVSHYGQQYSQARLEGRPATDFASWRSFAHSTAALLRAWPSVNGSSLATGTAQAEPRSTEHAVLRKIGHITYGAFSFGINHIDDVAVLTYRPFPMLRAVDMRSGAGLGGTSSMGAQFANLLTDHGWAAHNVGAYCFEIFRFESLEPSPESRRGALKYVRTIQCPSTTGNFRLHFPYLAT